jgi:hypothetical protein
MGTRATYNIKSEDGLDTFIYQHWDNYPTGASLSFYKALNFNLGVSRCGQDVPYILAENFIRANEDARLTESHEIHGDTEYRYDLNKNHLTAWRLSDYGTDWSNHGHTTSDDFEMFFSGDLDEFISQNDKLIREYDKEMHQVIDPTPSEQYATN